MEVGTAPVWRPVLPPCHRVPSSVHLQRHHRGLPQPGAQEHSQEHPKERRATVSSISSTSFPPIVRVEEQTSSLVKKLFLLLFKAGCKEVQVQRKNKCMHANASVIYILTCVYLCVCMMLAVL